MKKKLFRPIKASDRTGYCLCGCGNKTKIATITRNDRGDKKGFPVRYLPSHNSKDPLWRKLVTVWTSKTNWNGGRTIHQGYVLKHRRTFTKKEYEFLLPMFLKYNKRGVYIPEHRALLALKEKRILRADEFVRHLDGNRSNNSMKNLILGSAKDNYLDHDSARKEVVILRHENTFLKELLTRYNIVWQGTVEELKKQIGK